MVDRNGQKAFPDCSILEFLPVETIKHHSIDFKSSANTNYSQMYIALRRRIVCVEVL